MFFSRSHTHRTRLLGISIAGGFLLSACLVYGSERLQPSSDLYHVFPAEVSSERWENAAALRSRDVAEDGLYQDFQGDNAATLNLRDAATTSSATESTSELDSSEADESTESTEPESAPASSTPEAASSTATDEASPTTPAEDVGAASDTSTTTETTPEPAESSEPSSETATDTAEAAPSSTEAEADEVNEADATSSDTATTSALIAPFRALFVNVFTRAVGHFPFVSESTTTEEVATTSDDTDASTPATEEESPEPDPAAEADTAAEASSSSTEAAEDDAATASSSTTDDATDQATASTDATTTDRAAEVAASSTAVAASSTESEAAGTTTDSDASSTAAVSGVATSSAPTDTRETGDEVVSDPVATTAPAVASSSEDISGIAGSSVPENHITLRDFGIPSLRSGQAIETVQLRVSLGSRMESIDPEALSGLQATYTVGSFSGTAGTIIFDGETSNALNGGYFLLGLPTVTDPELLRDLEIVLSYEGDAEALESVYVDSAWLEVSTRSFERSALTERMGDLQFGHLKRPDLSELISTERNFSSRDLPHFNFRYNAQRNFVIRTARKLFGRDLAELRTVTFRHRDLGDVGITPELNVTSDGLVTVEVREEDRERLRPGEYTLELEIAEGGRTFYDSFDFQWGMLSINTHQTTYTPEQTVEFSLGALSPNGNTVCNANLELYVVAPDEAVKNVPVNQSGVCDGNNVVDVPDYTARYNPGEAGEYEYYLERLDEAGNVISYTSDTFLVEDSPSLLIERDGPTRIYPPATYTAELTVHTYSDSFDGTLTEYVPSSFEITNTDARMSTVDGRTKLEWDISQMASSTQTVRYDLNAPNLSPYLFTLGAAELTETSRGTTTEDADEADAARTFREHRAWQIASDAVGNMILFWDDDGAIPPDWTCLSCGSGTFFERFARGGDTYNLTGGSVDSTHTALGSVEVTGDIGVVEDRGGADIASGGHSHAFSPSVTTESNLPEYRTLRVIQYTGGAGEPSTIPAGAIAIFDDAVPAGWTRYSAQDGRYIYGADTVGTLGGANTHVHTVSGAIEAAGGSTIGSRGGPGQTDAAAAGHTHTLADADTSTVNQEPPYIEAVLGQIDADGAPPVGMISMWTEDIPAGWIDVSSDEAAPFHDRFIKPASSYGTTGGTETHAHPDITGLTTSAPNNTASGRSGSVGAGANHTHTVNITGFDTVNHLPPYVTAVFGKRIGLDTTYEQFSYRWYANEDDQTPGTPWPAGGSGAVAEQEPITNSTTPVQPDDVLRLRLSAQIDNATSTPGDTFALQYASTAGQCSSATGWSNVGGAGSGEIWRGFDNGSVTDGSEVTTTLLATSTAGYTYEETGAATGTPVALAVDAVGEWDFVLQNNGADPGTTYCFRVVEEGGEPLFAYATYPQLITDSAPVEPTQSLRFNYENTAETMPYFEFAATDPEGDTLDYQIQVASDPSFSSIVIDRDSVADPFDFENRALLSDRAPFLSGNLIRFLNDVTLTDDTTYWWRTRARDPDGADTWGEWADEQSFTITTSLTASGWLQRTDEQFAGNTLAGTEVSGSDSIQLISGSTTGTVVTPAIDFNDGADGSSWDEMRVVDDTTNGTITYQVEYQDEGGEWDVIPDGDLAGNESGFTAGPIGLVGLSVDTYQVIRLVATLEDDGGTPFLEEWAVDWGFRVETPTVDTPFPNEKVGDTTPSFIFSTEDPQDNDITYQIDWSTDRTFASGVTTRTSDTDAGFVNLDDGANTDPFTSGDLVQFTVQGGDALTDGETYWYRVRGKDTTGADEYSFYSEPRSFTVDTAVTASTWFQGTQAQFQTNTLAGTTGTTSGVTVATDAEEAMIVYGEGNENTPRYRLWDGDSWGEEASLLDIGATVRWVVTQAGTTREEYVAATIGSNSNVRAQVYQVGEWNDQVTLTTSIGDTTARGFDVAYETVSGRAMVVSCDGGSDPTYRIWDGDTWTAAATITTGLGGECEWLDLASDPTSDEIVMVVRDESGDPYEAQVWDGTAWGDSTTFGTSRSTAPAGLAVTYTESGGEAIVVVPSGNPPARFTYNSWDGTAWSGANTQAIAGRLYWASLARNTGNDDLVLCYMNDEDAIGAIRYSGGTWTGDFEFTGATAGSLDPGFACAFEHGGGRDNYILGTYSDATQSNYRTFDTASWSGANQVNTLASAATMQIIRTGVDLMLGVFLDGAAGALRFTSWDGSAWSATETLENDISVGSAPYGSPYMIAPRNDGSEGSVVVSPPIEFSDGSGPYFEEFSWNDTVPGSSSITYQVQYFDTSSETWEFIPDADLPGNDSGFTTSPVDLTALPVATYDRVRPYASLACDGSGACPTVNDWTVSWAEGITISGTATELDGTTPVADGTVAVAVNGVLQTGVTGTISSGTWSIDNVTVFADDVVTVFVSGGTEGERAVAVARYAGTGNMEDVSLVEEHLTLGANTAEAYSNADIGLFTNSDNGDVFYEVSGGDLTLCATTGCASASTIVQSTASYTPGGAVTTHDFANTGTLALGGDTIALSGSWENSATSTLESGTVHFTAATGTETVTQTGAAAGSFGTLTFGDGASTATWQLQQAITATQDLTVAAGTLDRGSELLTLEGGLTTASGATWSGLGTTTFAGTGNVTWSDGNTTPENVGYVVIDGGGKTVLLGGDVAAESMTIESADTLDATNNNYSITVFGPWRNANTFRARGGEVIMASPLANTTITTGGDAFADLTFSEGSGSWSFTEPELTVGDDLTITAGTVTFPTGTTTIGGSFLNSGTFAHNTSLTRFTGSGTHDITLSGSGFTNTLADATFTGSGAWTMTDTNATSSGDVLIENGSVTLPSGELAVGGDMVASGSGSIVANDGLVRLYGDATHTIAGNGSAFHDLTFADSGTYEWTDSDATLTGSKVINAGAVVLPAGTLTVGGSFLNNASFTAGSGTVSFTAEDTGHTVRAGTDPFASLTFDGAGGGWDVESATTTGDVALEDAGAFVLLPSETLTVGGTFTNAVGSASTTWTDSTLRLTGGSFAVNDKTDPGDTYGTVALAPAAAVSWWHSAADSYDVTGSLYSQDHADASGDLYIFGDYARSSGAEYWRYDTDFDGTDLGTTTRAVAVRLAPDSTVSLASSTLAVAGTTGATTTVASQGGGTYTIDVRGGTTTASGYEFTDLGSTGLSLLASTSVTTLENGRFVPAIEGGAAITVSSTTIDANPAQQFSNVTFATTTAISASNVAQTDGEPASFWWFRDGAGNLYGESFDTDSGDPGSIRWDDSSLLLTLSGTVYADGGDTPLTTGACDGSTPVVTVVVSGGDTYTTSCSAADGSYEIADVVAVGDPTFTVYLDTNGGDRGAVVTKTPTTDVTDLDIYRDRVIVRHEDSAPLTIADLAAYDAGMDSDVPFTAATGTTPSVAVAAGNELYLWPGKTFAPTGDITILPSGSGTGYDGSLRLATSSTLTAFSTSTIEIGGRFVLESGSTFTPASTTVTMTATSSGKSITADDPLALHNLSFTGSGAWHLGAALTLSGDMVVADGTVTGTEDITLTAGSITGSGTLSLGGGTTTLRESTTLGGATPWTFYDLALGDGGVAGTTTPAFSAVTVANTLTVATAHTLRGGAATFNLTGDGTVLARGGSFVPETSTVRYRGAAATVAPITYHALTLEALVDTGTYSVTGSGILVEDTLTVGGAAASELDGSTDTTLLSVRGDVSIAANGTVIGHPTRDLLVGGDWSNSGTFSANSNTVVFDGTASQDIAAGASPFANVSVAGSGAVRITEHATATDSFALASHDTFTVDSNVTVALGGDFSNTTGGSDTTWSDSTLRFYGGGSRTINAATTSDSYGTLAAVNDTHVRMWQSDAAQYTTAPGSSIYSKDHGGVDGALTIFGDYERSAGTDHWSYATDFDGATLSGGATRAVDVAIEGGGSVRYDGASTLQVIGADGFTTDLSAHGTGTYGFTIGSGASTEWDRAVVRDVGADGVVFSGTPTVNGFSRTDHLVAIEDAAAVTVGGTVIDENSAETFTENVFALAGGIASGTNVRATGTTASSWRFTNHTGNLAGEDFDTDPAGDPGYLVWDDSAALITVAGTVYSDEGSTVSSVCDGTTENIELRVAGVTSYTTTCDPSTGAYSIADVAFGATDTMTLYISGEAVQAANVTVDPVTSLSSMDLYEDRLIVRHESGDPMTITDLAAWDSSDDGDVPFTTTLGGSAEVTIPAGMKLLVWDSKTFAPGGDITLAGTSGTAPDGDLEVRANGTLEVAAGEVHTVGGNLELASGASITDAAATFVFTSTASDAVVTLRGSSLHEADFTGSGTWTVTDNTLTVLDNFSIADGSVVLPSATTTIGGDLAVDTGSFDANGGTVVFAAEAGTATVQANNSSFNTVQFVGAGSWDMTDAAAVVSGDLSIASSTVTFPATSLTVGGDLRNTSGTIDPQTGLVDLTTAATSTLELNGSDLHDLTLSGSGTMLVSGTTLSLLGDLRVPSGTLVGPTDTLTVGGSFDIATGTVDVGTSTVLLNSATGGNSIAVGANDLHTLQISAPSGGYTLADDVTTVADFTLQSTDTFAVATGTTVTIGGTFTNQVGGTATDWADSTIVLTGSGAYTINSKTTDPEEYGTLDIRSGNAIRLWNTDIATPIVAADSSLYSQNHANGAGDLHIYGDFSIGTTTEYWSYETDFDGTDLSGAPRSVSVSLGDGATTTVSGSGALEIEGGASNRTTVQSVGSGTYALLALDGTFLAREYEFTDLSADGLQLYGTTVVEDLASGSFELAVDGGSTMTVGSTTINANASRVFNQVAFSAPGSLTGANVTVLGETESAWRFQNASGDLAGEDFDDDGASQCGSIRWDDSTCLQSQQSQVRWRFDDGGEGVPDDEWFDQDWSRRTQIQIVNNDAVTYEDAVVRVPLDYEGEMNSDFSDIRFTSDTGTTTIAHWTERVAANTDADVWVTVPELPASGQATVFVYYGNSGAVSSSSLSAVSSAGEDFEDGDLSAFSGQTDGFETTTSRSFGGDRSLVAFDTNERMNEGGMFRTDRTIEQGETIRYMQYVDTVDGSEDEICTLFAVQSPGTASENYGVCIEQFQTDRISIVRDVVENDSSGTMLASSTVSYQTGWYEVAVDWETDGTITASLYDPSGNLAASPSAVDNTYTSGGYGFTYWVNHGAWDGFISYPRLATDPEVFLGVPQGSGGATWAAAQNDPSFKYAPGDIARVRVAVENLGLDLTDQNFRLEYSPLGGAPSCESIAFSEYTPVPTSGSCGSSPLCMTGSSFVSLNDPTTNALVNTIGSFVSGQIVADTNNRSGALDVLQDEYTELEYVLEATNEASEPSYCLVVSNDGSALDFYETAAQFELRFDPFLTDDTLNDGMDILLTPGTTTPVVASSTVTDLNGFADITAATTTLYRSGVSGGALCDPNDNDCYVMSTENNQCELINCADNSCTLQCTADVWFHADPTDGGDYEGQEWFAFMEVEDSNAGYDFTTPPGVDLLTMRALDVDQGINYGALEPDTDTGSFNPTTNVFNIGNDALSVEVEGDDLTDDASSVIPAERQKVATSTFTYDSCVSCAQVSSAAPVAIGLQLSKPSSSTPPVSADVYWGIEVPFGVTPAPHSGINIFYGTGI